MFNQFPCFCIYSSSRRSIKHQANQHLQDLRDEVAQLRANQREVWLDEHRAGEIKTLIRDVLADADLRASLVGKKFYLASEDGGFLADRMQ